MARPFLETLRDRTGQTVHFAPRTGDEAVYVDKVDGRRYYQIRSRVGLPLPLHSSAIGKALVAELSETEVPGIVDRTNLARSLRLGRLRRAAPVSQSIADHALLGDCQGRALVGARRVRAL